jgi:hypothetical protein
MSNPRDPQVVAIAQKLARDCPYGSSDTYVIGAPPSAADYHAARIALRTLEEIDGYEYSMATIGLDGDWKVVGDVMDRYNKNPIWRDREITQKMVNWYINDSPHSDFKLVKRRKAGRIEDV